MADGDRERAQRALVEAVVRNMGTQELFAIASGQLGANALLTAAATQRRDQTEEERGVSQVRVDIQYSRFFVVVERFFLIHCDIYFPLTIESRCRAGFSCPVLAAVVVSTLFTPTEQKCAPNFYGSWRKCAVGCTRENIKLCII